MTKASNVILVHGAWADGSSWSKVIPLLLDGGLRVTAVQLPLMSLKDDVATVKRAIAVEDGPIILVGHSYGGVVITEAGDDPKVAGLVYIAAFAPDVGQSVGSLGASVEPAPMGAEVRPDAQGFLKLTEAGVKNDFAQDLTPTEKSILFAAQAPTAAAAFGENVSVASWKAKPSWYLVATADRAIQPSLERAMAKAINAKTVEIASSHVAMLARPEETANLILEAAGRASPSIVGLKSAWRASPLMEGRPMAVDPSARKPGDDWIAIVRKNGMPEFAAAFAANPVLHTSVMSGPCVGVEAVAAVFAATAGGMYDTLAFTHETVDGPKTYLEWEGKAFGKSVGGTTILTRNEAGLIQSIQIYHRPLHMVLQFSAELENRLKGKVSPSLFATRDWNEFSRCSHHDSAWRPSR